MQTQFVKANVRTISKLTRKLKAIDFGKTKDPKNTKLDGKAAKLAEELKLLKAAKKLEMVKKVFLFNQDPEKALKLQKSSAEHRAICRLLMNDFLKEAVAATKTKLNITDEEEEWKGMLFGFGKNKKKALMKAKYEKASGVEPTTALEKKIAAKKAKNKAKKLAKKEGGGVAKEGEADKKEGDKKDEETKKKSPLDAKSTKIEKDKRKEKFEQKKRQFMKAKISDGPATKPRPPVDNSPPKKVNLFPVEAKDAAPKKFNKDSGDAKKWNNDKPRFNKDKPASAGGFQRAPAGRAAPEKPAEKLHPSWEAKKQKKPAISEFKGKKTTFDD